MGELETQQALDFEYIQGIIEKDVFFDFREFVCSAFYDDFYEKPLITLLKDFKTELITYNWYVELKYNKSSYRSISPNKFEGFIVSNPLERLEHLAVDTLGKDTLRQLTLSQLLQQYNIKLITQEELGNLMTEHKKHSSYSSEVQSDYLSDNITFGEFKNKVKSISDPRDLLKAENIIKDLKDVVQNKAREIINEIDPEIKIEADRTISINETSTTYVSKITGEPTKTYPQLKLSWRDKATEKTRSKTLTIK